MQIVKGFKEEELTIEQSRHLRDLSRQARGDVLRMIHLAGGGHPGGSLSSVDLYVTLLAAVNLRPTHPEDPRRDRVVVSHGHTAPALYASLGRLDFFDLDDAVGLFRKAGSIFEGNPERTVPGVEWTSGNLGLGLSAACGFALAGRVRGHKYNVFVMMSDGEQQKGQVSEARRFAKKSRLNNITVLIDVNATPASGRSLDITAQSIKHEYIADGWDVIEINGHDHSEIYKALRRAIQIQSSPVLVLANTNTGAGVSFMEGNADYHGKSLSEAEFLEAMGDLRMDPDLGEPADYRDAFGDFDLEIEEVEPTQPSIDLGKAFEYGPKQVLANREALGRALADLGRRNSREGERSIAVVDCHHAPIAGLDEYAKSRQEAYFHFGVQDHAAATAAGAMSLDGVVTVLTTASVFGLDAIYNQLRVNDLNRSNLKLVVTDIGLDAGQGGKAVQCVDYIGLCDNLFGFKAVFPADPNQTDRALRYALGQPGNWLVGVGHTALPVVTDLDGKPFYVGDYEFEYGRVDLIRPGESGVILATGQILTQALRAWDALRELGMEPSVLHVACPKGLDDSEDPTLAQCLRKGRVITYEDHNVQTGLGSRVANYIATRGVSCRLMKIGVEKYGVSGQPDEVYRKAGLDVETLVARAQKFLKR